MYAARLWSVRHARAMERLYAAFETTLVALHPLLKKIGYARLERPMEAVERGVKGLLFDCQMCGQCALSSTGMSCPMNCPKSLRNGPCGGVRANGHCEVKPEMKCVRVKDSEGSPQIVGGKDIPDVQKPVDNTLQRHSSFLLVRPRQTRPPPP